MVKPKRPNLRYRAVGLDGETIINEKREIRSKTDNKYWHKAIPDGSPVFSCKCAKREHHITWNMLQDIFLRLKSFQGERWDLICDGETVSLLPPGAKHQGKPFNTRLVSIEYHPDHKLIFYQIKK